MTHDSETESTLHRLCDAGELAPGEMKAVNLPGLPALAVFNIDGDYLATSNLCTHQVALLTDGYLDGDCVECPMHGGSFNVRSGKPMSFPCTVPLQTYPLKVDGGRVLLVLSTAV